MDAVTTGAELPFPASGLVHPIADERSAAVHAALRMGRTLPQGHAEALRGQGATAERRDGATPSAHRILVLPIETM
jgi:hypothetical protein